MTPHFDTRKIIIAVLACAIVSGGAVLLDKSGILSGFLGASPAAAAHSENTASVANAHSGGEASVTVSGVVNINTANIDSLMTLKGIGSSKADAIVAYRTKNGIFYKPEDIMNVSGIGPAIFAGIKDKITVGDVGSAPAAPAGAGASSAPQQATQTQTPVSVPHVLITQVMAGNTGNSAYEFIELYNAGSDVADLTGWSVKKKTSSGAVSTLVSTPHFKGKSIPAGKYFLLASAGYNGTPAADLVWPSSYSVASTNNSVILYDATGNAVDTVNWTDIPEGKSYLRSVGSDSFSVSTPAPKNSSF